jgi:hypothetical protein
VTLDDGTMLMFPASLKSWRGALRIGAMIKAAYEVKGGQKVVTSIEAQPPEKKPKP